MSARKLGTGLDALLGSWTEEPAPAAAAPGTEIAVADIRPNPYQPRAEFDEADLRSLAESIKGSGLLQPVVVRRQAGLYELVAGERRWRAARMAGLTSIPAVVRDADDSQMLLFALVENVQRKDLNPVEKARAVRVLLGQTGASHEKSAAALGMDRSTLTNLVRLLDLPPEILAEVSRGTISAGHARALLGAPRLLQMKLALQIVRDGLSVRQVETLVAAAPGARTTPRKGPKTTDPNLAAVEQTLSDHFATRVRVEPHGKGGKIVIDYYDTPSFNAILSRLGLLEI